MEKMKFENSVKIEGYVYSHKLEEKVIKPLRPDGTPNPRAGETFITGSLSVAVDEDAVSVITVQYPFVSPKFKSGSENNSYKVLKEVISTDLTWEKVGSNAMKVRCTPNLGVNDWYDVNNDRAIAGKRCEAGFVSKVTELIDEKDVNRNSFKVDALIYEAVTEEKNGAEVLTLRTYIFDYNRNPKPFDFVVKTTEGIQWFESQYIDQQHPLFTKIWGRVVSTKETVKSQTGETAAFGEVIVDTRTRNIREYVVTGANGNPYDFGDESVMSVEEFNQKLADREVALAKIKTDAINRANAPKAATSAPSPMGAMGRPALNVGNATFNY